MASPTVPFWEEGATVLVSDRVYDVDKEEGKRDFSAWAKKKGASKKDAARITEPVIFEEIMVVSTDSSKTLPGPRDWIVPPFSPSPRPLFAHGSSNRHAKEDEAILKEILGDYPLTPFHTGGTTETESTIVAECIQRFPGQAAALQVSSVGRLFSERSFERNETSSTTSGKKQKSAATASRITKKSKYAMISSTGFGDNAEDEIFSDETVDHDSKAAALEQQVVVNNGRAGVEPVASQSIAPEPVTKPSPNKLFAKRPSLAKPTAYNSIAQDPTKSPRPAVEQPATPKRGLENSPIIRPPQFSFPALKPSAPTGRVRARQNRLPEC